MTGMELFEIGEVAAQVGRVPHTVRQWDRSGRLPVSLRPVRNARNRRLWTQEQIDGIKQWIIDADMTPGKAFRKGSK